MSLTVIIIIIVAALAFILSNIITLQKSKSFSLPDSYKARKAAEAEHLAKLDKNNVRSTSRSKGYENDFAKEEKEDNW